MERILILAMALLASLRSAPALDAQAPRAAFLARDRTAQRGRPKIILIHGRAQEYRVASQLRSEWLGALQDGLGKLGIAGEINLADDVELISYQDAFEPQMPTPEGCDPSELTADHYTHAQGGSDLIGRVFSRRYRSAVMPLRNRLARTLRSPKLVTGALSDVDTYFQPNGGIACAINRRLTDSLVSSRREDRPVILVAHSLGSLVSYRVLVGAAAQNDTFHIARLVTIGSQLPYRKLLTYYMPDSTSVAFPPGVEQWINVIGLGDLAAFAARDEPAYATDPRIAEVHVPTDPADPHSAVAYLKNPVAALAIARGWCSAFHEPATAPAKCTGLRYFLAPDVVDELTPERFTELPVVSFVIASDIRGSASQSATFGAQLEVPSLALLPAAPTLLMANGDIPSGAWSVRGGYPIPIMNGFDVYPQIGGGTAVFGDDVKRRVALAGVGVRLSPARLLTGVPLADVVGIFFEKQWGIALRGGTNPGMSSWHVGFYYNPKKYVNLFRASFRDAKPCGNSGDPDYALTSWLTPSASSAECIGAVRLARDTRRAIAKIVAAHPRQANGTSPDLDAAMARIYAAASNDRFFDTVAVVEATDALHTLGSLSAVRPDAIVLPLSVAERLSEPVFTTLGSDSALRHIATIVVVPVGNTNARARCERLRATWCTARWDSSIALRAVARAFALQEQRVAPLNDALGARADSSTTPR